MRRVGDHMIAEVDIMARQADVAAKAGDVTAYDALRTLVDDLGQSINRHELRTLSRPY